MSYENENQERRYNDRQRLGDKAYQAIYEGENALMTRVSLVEDNVETVKSNVEKINTNINRLVFVGIIAIITMIGNMISSHWK